MKTKITVFSILFLISLFMTSCSDLSNKDSNNESTNNYETNNESSETVQLYKYILKRDINNSKWYKECVSDYYCYYSFKDGRISYKSGRAGSNIVSADQGNYYFENGSQTQFKYKWDSMAGEPHQSEIIIIDNDIIVLSSGFAEIAYKDISTYTENTPFMGLGKFSEMDGSEWVVFTPSGNCYKRYIDFSKEDYYIACGHWEKNFDNSFKIYWENNTKDYDILKEKLLYQNINKNPYVIPITLYVNNL